MASDDLIERLRLQRPLMSDAKAAADALEAKDKRIAELEEDCEMRRAVNFGQSQTIDGYVARIAALEAAIEAKDISIKTLSMLLRTNLLLRHPDRTYEEVDADIRKIVEGTDV